MMTTIRHRARTDWLPLLVLAAAACLALFPGLGREEMQPWDEALYAIRARACVEQGAWADQTAQASGGLYSSAQPPLGVWLTAASFALFGEREWSARLPSAVAALLLVIGCYGFLRRYAGRAAAFAAAASLAAAEPLLAYAGAAQLDLVQLTAGAFAFFLFFRGWELGSRRRYAAAGLLLGLALLAKLFIALLAASTWLAALLVMDARRAPRALLWTLLPAAALASPWYVAMAVAHPGYLAHLAASVGAVAFTGYTPSSGASWWYYGNRLVLALPLLPLAFASLATANEGEAGARAGVAPAGMTGNALARRLGLAALLWLAVPVLLLTMGATKMPHFVLPLLPPAALLVGLGAERVQRLGERWNGALAACVALCLLWGASGALRVWSKEHALATAAAAAAAAALAFLIARSRAARRAAQRAPLLAAACAALLLTVRCVERLAPPPAGESGARAAAALLEHEGLRRAVVLHHATRYSDRVPALAWYLRGWEQREDWAQDDSSPGGTTQRCTARRCFSTLAWNDADSLRSLAERGGRGRLAMVLYRPWLPGAEVSDAERQAERRARRGLDALGASVLRTANYDVWVY